jgi:hypothetical protein
MRIPKHSDVVLSSKLLRTLTSISSSISSANQMLHLPNASRTIVSASQSNLSS